MSKNVLSVSELLWVNSSQTEPVYNVSLLLNTCVIIYEMFSFSEHINAAVVFVIILLDVNSDVRFKFQVPSSVIFFQKRNTAYEDAETNLSLALEAVPIAGSILTNEKDA